MDEPPASLFWDPVAQSAIAEFIAQSTWAYPALETLHIFGIALVFGPILIFDLRVLGFNQALEFGALRRALLPWVWTGFATNVTSGGLLFISDAAEFASNPAFRVKLALLALAGLNALAFQWRLAPAASGGNEASPGAAARRSAALSIALWLAIIAAGRLMAYVK